MLHALALTLVIGSTPAPTPYEVSYPLDLALTAGTFGTLILLHQAGPSVPHDYVCTPAAPAEPCDRDDLSWLDRGTVGKRSRSWLRVSDWALGTTMGLVAGATLIDNAWADGDIVWSAAAADALVIAESIGVATLTAHVLRYAVRRPRPTQYVLGTPVEPSERHLSFPSAHASSASAAATAYAVTHWLRHPDSPWRWAVLGAGAAAAGFVALGRVEAGRHFPSDVLGGLFVGMTAGVAVPMLHLADMDVIMIAGETKQVVLSGEW